MMLDTKAAQTAAMEFRVERCFWANGFDIAIMGHASGRISRGSLTFADIQDGAYSEPTARISFAEAQGLMDELWRAGVRPADGTGSTGQLAATERHLEDMRGIAKAALRAKGVKA